MVCRMSKTAVALFEDIDWRTVGNCVKAAHNRIEPDITAKMHDLRRICVDETSYRKGFAYITVVYDMDRNRVVWIHEGSGLEIFRLFCEALSPEERRRSRSLQETVPSGSTPAQNLTFPMRLAALISSMSLSGPLKNSTRYGLPLPPKHPGSMTAGNKSSEKRSPEPAETGAACIPQWQSGNSAVQSIIS